MFYIGNVLIKNRIVIAPMAGITDMPYRFILKRFGASLMTTELVSAKAYINKNENTFDIMKTNKDETPIALQIFGSDKYILAEMIQSVYTNYDIIDFNMGCPVPKVVRNGEGSALLKDLDKTYDIVSYMVKVANKKIPITCKIRIGFDNNHINAVECAKMLESAGVSCITVHGRTRQEMYKGNIHLDVIKKVKQNVKIPVIGNGNIFSIYDAKKMLEETNCDGIAIGRGLKGNPWFVKECIEYIENGNIIERPTNEQIKSVMLDLIDLEVAMRGEERAVNELKSHLCWFVSGMKNSSKLRVELNNTNSVLYLKTIINNFFIDKI